MNKWIKICVCIVSLVMFLICSCTRNSTISESTFIDKWKTYAKDNEYDFEIGAADIIYLSDEKGDQLFYMPFASYEGNILWISIPKETPIEYQEVLFDIIGLKLNNEEINELQDTAEEVMKSNWSITPDEDSIFVLCLTIHEKAQAE